MKKLLISFLLFLGIFSLLMSQSFANCSFDPGSEWANIWYALEECFEDASVVNTTMRDDAWNAWITFNLTAEGWFKIMVESWIKILGWVLAILAVGSIVYGSLLLVLSGWQEEKLKKWKDVIKWWILWFLGVVFAGVLITIVVNIMFWI